MTKTSLNICQLNWLNEEEIFDQTSQDQWLTLVNGIRSSNRLMKFLVRLLMKFLVRYQLILEYVKIKNLLPIRLEVSIRAKSWLGYCPYKSFPFFSPFGLFEISDQLFNFSLSDFYVFNFHFRSPANLYYMFSIVISSATRYVISIISVFSHFD